LRVTDVAVTASAHTRFDVSGLVNPYVIATSGLTLAVVAAVAAPGKLAPLLVGCALFAGWSSARSP
jgi:hypothetical protein